MTYLFDNCIAPQIPEGLRAFGKDAWHLAERLRQDADDPEILKYCGRHNIRLITEDKRIRHNPEALKAYHRQRVGVFFLLGKEMSRWQRVLQVVRAWEKIEHEADNASRPFSFTVNRHGTQVRRIDLR